MNTPSKPRFYALDVLKLIWLVTILHFHSYETFFYNDDFIMGAGESLLWVLHYPIRALSFSGFAIVTLTSFLLGWVHLTAKKWMSLMGILGLGALLLAWLNGDQNHTFYLQWDIYYFHFASFGIIALLQTQKKWLYALSVAFLPLLFIPVWNWDYLLNNTGWIKDAVLGDCTKDGHGSWPLLPWLAMPLAMYSLADVIKSDPSYKQRLFSFDKKELWVWSILLIAALPWLDGYFFTPIGPQFGCYMHRQPPLSFWSHWIWVLFLIRMGFLNTVNDYLKSKKWVQFISSLEWSKNMGLAYALHFLFLNIGYRWIDVFREHQFLVDIFNISMLVGVELACRILRYLYVQTKNQILRLKQHLQSS